MPNLTRTEAARLLTCERQIDQAVTQFAAAGSCLRTIRDDKLYRQEYASFNDYLSDRWGFTRQRAHQLIQSSAEVEDLPALANEMAAREYSKQTVPVKRVIKEKLAGVPKVRAKDIKQVVMEHEEGEDSGGAAPSPDSWFEDKLAASESLSEILTSLFMIRKKLREESEWNHYLGGFRSKDTDIFLVNLITAVKWAIPHSICPECDGDGVGCETCEDRSGWVNKETWDAFSRD